MINILKKTEIMEWKLIIALLVLLIVIFIANKFFTKKNKNKKGLRGDTGSHPDPKKEEK